MKKQALANLVAEKLAAYGAVNLPIVLGVSGGADSMALLDLTRRMVFAENMTVVHIHHGLRKSAMKDARLVEAYCAKYRLAFRLREVDVVGQKKLMSGGVEEVARELRHKALREEAEKVGAVYILLAHHADDQAETVLFNLVRGASLRGLGGMRELNGKVLRPLLAVSKADLLAYCKAHKLAYVTDETNKNVRYTRNYIRLKVIPLLAKINPQVVAQIAATTWDVQAAENAAKDLARLHVAAMAKASVGRVELPISKLLELSQFMRFEVVKFVVELLGSADYEWSGARLEQIEQLIKSRESKVKKHLPSRLLVEKLYDKIAISLGNS